MRSPVPLVTAGSSLASAGGHVKRSSESADKLEIDFDKYGADATVPSQKVSKAFYKEDFRCAQSTDINNIGDLSDRPRHLLERQIPMHTEKACPSVLLVSNGESMLSIYS